MSADEEMLKMREEARMMGYNHLTDDDLEEIDQKNRVSTNNLLTEDGKRILDKIEKERKEKEAAEKNPGTTTQPPATATKKEKEKLKMPTERAAEGTVVSGDAREAQPDATVFTTAAQLAEEAKKLPPLTFTTTIGWTRHGVEVRVTRSFYSNERDLTQSLDELGSVVEEAFLKELTQLNKADDMVPEKASTSTVVTHTTEPPASTSGKSTTQPPVQRKETPASTFQNQENYVGPDFGGINWVVGRGQDVHPAPPTGNAWTMVEPNPKYDDATSAGLKRDLLKRVQIQNGPVQVMVNSNLMEISVSGAQGQYFNRNVLGQRRRG